MPNLQCASPVGHDEEGHSYEAQTVCGRRSRRATSWERRSPPRGGANVTVESCARAQPTVGIVGEAS